MSDLKFNLIVRWVDQAATPAKALATTVAGGASKMSAAMNKVTAGVQKLTVAEKAGKVSAQQLAMAAEGIKKGVAPASAFERGLQAVTRAGTTVKNVLDQIDRNNALRKEGQQAEALAGHSEHANHKLRALLRTLAETAELGPMGHLLAHVTPWLGAAALGFGAVTAARGIYEMAKGAAEHGAEVMKGAAQVGLQPEDFQRLSYAGQQFEVTQEDLSTGLKRFSRNAYDAAKGGKAQLKVFKDLGVHLRDGGPKGKQRTVTDLFAATADKIAAMGTSLRRTALAQEAFGRGGAAMIPLLEKGGAAIRGLMNRADQLGLVLDRLTLEKSEAFMHAMREAGAALTGLKWQLGAALLPVLTAATEKLTAFIVAHRVEVVNRFKGALQWMIDNSPKLFAALKSLAKIDWVRFAHDMAATAGAFATLIGWVGQVVGKFGGMQAVLRPIGWLFNALTFPARDISTVFLGLADVASYLLDHWTVDWAGIKSTVMGAVDAVSRTLTGFTPSQWMAVWDRIPAFFSGLWDRTAAAFVSGVNAIWNRLPTWFQLLLKFNGMMLQLSIGMPSIPGVAKPPAAANSNAPARPGAAPTAFSSPRPQGAPTAFRPAASAPAAVATPAAMRARLDVHVTRDGQVEVRQGGGRNDFDISVHRGQAA